MRYLLTLFAFFLPLWAIPTGNVLDGIDLDAPREYFDISREDAIAYGILDENDDSWRPTPALAKRDIIDTPGTASATCPILHRISTPMGVKIFFTDDTCRVDRGTTIVSPADNAKSLSPGLGAEITVACRTSYTRGFLSGGHAVCCTVTWGWSNSFECNLESEESGAYPPNPVTATEVCITGYTGSCTMNTVVSRHSCSVAAVEWE